MRLTSMRAAVVRRFGGPEVIEALEVPMPEPGPGQVRIRVAASSVSRIDLSARAGRLVEAGLMLSSDRIGLGWDVAGHVDAIGPNVSGSREGDAVVGLRDLLFAGGTNAEQVVLDSSAVAAAPRSVPLSTAAALPLNALTADRSLVLAGLHRGQTLLVTGAAGSVGGFVLELAARRGIVTIGAVRAGVAREGDAELVRRLGGEPVVVPPSGSLGPVVRSLVPGGVDAVIDAAVLGIGAHDALRGGGAFVALVAPFAPPPIRGTRVVVQEVFADGARLGELAAMVDAGLLTLRIARSLPLDAVGEAHALLEAGGQNGRVLIEPALTS